MTHQTKNRTDSYTTIPVEAADRRNEKVWTRGRLMLGTALLIGIALPATGGFDLLPILLFFAAVLVLLYALQRRYTIRTRGR